MFEVTVIRTKAGHIGQVNSGGVILWESEPFPEEKIERPDDRLLRYSDLGAEKAGDAARLKVKEVLERLFQ